jgi:hypothetical protein
MEIEIGHVGLDSARVGEIPAVARLQDWLHIDGG